jgi:hypothetical protein
LKKCNPDGCNNDGNPGGKDQAVARHGRRKAAQRQTDETDKNTHPALVFDR